MNNRARSAMTGFGLDPDKPSALRALVIYASQNPGLEYGNYARGWDDKEGRAAYFSESRRITKDWHEVRRNARICGAVGVTDDDVIFACQAAFSGRLSVKRVADGYGVDYCTGQYWPTEYRKAVAVVLDYASNLAYRRAMSKAVGEALAA